MNLADNILDWFMENVMGWLMIFSLAILFVLLIVLGYLLLFSPQSKTFSLEKEGWQCTQKANVSRQVLIPVGKMLVPENRINEECIQWSHR